MVNALLANLTTFAVLVHGAAGCCWHHEHLPVSAASDFATFKPVVCGGHIHWPGASGESSDDDHRHEHDGPSSCGEATCSATAPPVRLAVESPASIAGVGLPATTLRLTGGPPGEGSPFLKQASSSTPLYLWHGVLVV